MRKTKIKVLVGSSELHKRSFMTKLRRFFKKSNTSGSPFQLRSFIHREISHLVHFFISEAKLGSFTEEGEVKTIASSLLQQTRPKTANLGNMLTEVHFQEMKYLFQDHLVEAKAREYIPDDILNFLKYFILIEENYKRLLEQTYKASRDDRRIFEYIISSENYSDTFLYDPGLNQYLVVQYSFDYSKAAATAKLSSTNTASTISYAYLNRQSSVSSVSYRGRRGSYESFDSSPVGYIYLLGLGTLARESSNYRSHTLTVLNEDIKNAAIFYRDNQLRTIVLFSLFQILPALLAHPFPNLDYFCDNEDFNVRNIPVPGTWSMKKLEHTATSSSLLNRHEFVRDVKNYFFESLIIEGIEAKDILTDFYEHLSSNDLLKIYSFA